MELMWATEDLVIGGRRYAGFPILLHDSMESCFEVNLFFRDYLLRGSIGSKKSWPSTGRALYDYFSFLQAHGLDWRGVDRGEAKALVAAFRDYCMDEGGLARSTTRQRLIYVCAFYVYAQKQGWVTRLPFDYEDRTVTRSRGFLAHVDASGGKARTNNVMPRAHKQLPKFLSKDEIKALLSAAENPHHIMIIRTGLLTGLRREELATFPLAYVFDPDNAGRRERNIRISLDPGDGHGMKTKGMKPRDIVVTRAFMSVLHRYAVQKRGERASLSTAKHASLFLNKAGEPYSEDGKRIGRIVRDLGKRIGLKVHPHMLRHTYATHTLVALQRNRGSVTVEPLVFVQRQLGHRSINTTMVYLHLINEHVDDVVLAYDDELNDWMGSS